MVEDPRPYRPCVGVMLLNTRGHVFVGNRIDMLGENWQMPQGGIDEGETPRDAALRELEEEAGTRKAEIIAESLEWFSYDLPEVVSRQRWGGRFRGQTQRWFVMPSVSSDRFEQPALYRQGMAPAKASSPAWILLSPFHGVCGS